MIRQFKSKIEKQEIQKNLSSSPSIRSSTLRPHRRKSISIQHLPSSTALSRGSMELSSPMVRQPQERPIRWKERLASPLPNSRASSQEWLSTSSVQSLRHLKTFSSELRCLWLNCTCKSWEISWTTTSKTLRFAQTRREESSLKTSLKNTFLLQMRFIN